MNSESLITAFLRVVPDTHVSDYAYLNLIDLHIEQIQIQVRELDHSGDSASQELILSIWKRLRRYYELRGKYSEGIRIAPLFRRAAMNLNRRCDAAWILLKDDLWLRVLRGDQATGLMELFEDVIDEFSNIRHTAVDDNERIDSAVGKFTSVRYVVGLLRQSSRVVLPRTKRLLTGEAAVSWCSDILDELRADDAFPLDTLSLLEARSEQTIANIELTAGNAESALIRYQKAHDLLNNFAPNDEEHLAIVRCKLAEAHLALAETKYDDKQWNGARRFTRDCRAARRLGGNHQQVAIQYLQSASTNASHIGWAEGEPRISEQLARAFRWEGNLRLALMFAERSAEHYRQLGNQKHVGRAELLCEQLQRDLHCSDWVGSNARSCDVLVLSRMHGNEDDEKLRIIREACACFNVAGRPLDARRVDEICGGGRITDTLIENIWHSKIVIAILDGARPNVLYELGLTHGQGLPVILCLDVDQKSEIPFDIKDFHIVVYDSLDDLTLSLKSQLRAELEALGVPFDCHPDRRA